MLIGNLDRERAISLLKTLKDRLDQPEPEGVIDELRRGLNGHTIQLAIWALAVAIDDMQAVDAFENKIQKPF